MAGVHLKRTVENVAEIDILAGILGGRAGVDDLLADLNRRGRRSYGFFGRAVDRAWTWDREDRGTREWWPQGITTSDAAEPSDLAGRRVLVVTWYAKPVAGVSRGSRLTFVDLDTFRYRHVLLVVPGLADGRLQLQPLRVHAGGLAWWGPYLHVAATSRGVMTCRLDDLMRIPDGVGHHDVQRLGVVPPQDHGSSADRAVSEGVASFGYRYVLPVRFGYRAYTDEGETGLRYSFLALDRSGPPALVAGEYGRSGQTTRIARFPLDERTALLATGEDGFSRPVDLDEAGVARMQGAAPVAGRWHLSVSNGPWFPSSVYVGTLDRLRELRLAAPMGSEDLAHSAADDRLWSLSEHPHRRWVYSMPRSRFD